MKPDAARAEVLHYVGYDYDRGGIVAVIRALAQEDRFDCRLGVNRGFAHSGPALPPAIAFPRIEGESIHLRSMWRARHVAGSVRGWLAGDRRRIYHGHSRAGLLVGLWLHQMDERHVIVSVHSYGRKRWFYRWAARRLGRRLYWLSPAMKRHYGLADSSWAQCIPGCVSASGATLPRVPGTGVVRCGGIGGLVPIKRWELVIEALALLPAHVRSRVSFRHIGSDDGTASGRNYADGLRRQSDAHGLSGVVQWLGHQSSADRFLAETDCLIVASSEEAFSIAMLEALRAGVPVIAPDAGGASDVVAPGTTGWLFRRGDPGDLARTIAALVETDALARVRIVPEALRRFSAPVVAEQWAQVYAQLSTGH